MTAIEGRTFYRYMSEAELEAIERTGFLRGARPGRTYWTDQRYESAAQARSMLGLRRLPEVRVRFRIRNDVNLRRSGEPVEPVGREPGGAPEWMTLDPVEVEVIEVDRIG